jgi:hypothetical protein
VNRSWDAGVRLRARVRVCRWRFIPETYRVRIDDTYDQTRHEMAARHLRMKLPEYLLFCASYVFRHHRDLAPVRAEIRKWDREERAQKRREAADRRKAERRWNAVHK